MHRQHLTLSLLIRWRERERGSSGSRCTSVCECVTGERKGRLCRGELIENFQASLSPSYQALLLLLSLYLHPKPTLLRQPFPNAFAVPKLQCLFAFVSCTKSIILVLFSLYTVRHITELMRACQKGRRSFSKCQPTGLSHSLTSIFIHSTIIVKWCICIYMCSLQTR